MAYADFTHSTFLNMLGTLDHLVGKAQDAGFADDVLDLRLIDDMFTLELQFRVAINQVLLALGRLANRTVPLDENAYLSLAEVRGKIAAARSQVEACAPSGWSASGAPVDITLPNGVRFVMTSEEDVRDWLLPNFYFHVTMVYALLRKQGLDIGKMDFLPHMSRHIVT